MPSARRAPLALLTALALVLGLAVSPAAAPAAQATPTTATLTGRVIMPPGLAVPTGFGGLSVSSVVQVNGALSFIRSASVAADGTFSLTGLVPGEHRIRIGGTYINTITMYYDGAFEYAKTTPLELSAGTNPAIEVQLYRGGLLNGTVLGEGGEDIGSAGIRVVSAPPAYYETGASRVVGFSNSRYTVSKLPPGEYVVEIFTGPSNPGWYPSFSGSARELVEAIPVVVGFDEQIRDADITMFYTPGITGTYTAIRHPSVTGPEPNEITARPFPGTTEGTVRRLNLEDQGPFRVPGLAPGVYQLCTSAGGSIDPDPENRTCYGQSAENPDGLPIVVGTEGQTSGVNIDVVMDGSILITGVLYPDPLGPGGFTSPNSVFAKYWRFDPSSASWMLEWEASRIGGGDDIYSNRALPPGEYRVEISYEDNSGTRYREYWPGGVTRFVDAEIVELLPGEQKRLVGMPLAPGDVARQRIFGTDRFSTAVQLSISEFADGSRPVVIIANGRNYPDALAAGPAAAALGGPLLLVSPTEIPAVVRGELARMQPSQIIIAGGTASVSAAVESQLRSYVTSPDDVVRLWGADRYATSRAVVDEVFGDLTGIPIFIATGSNYPDALAAGAAASYYGGAVLLVNGSATSIDTSTRALLDRLDPGFIVIAGGPGAVSSSIGNQLVSRYQDDDSPVVRLFGAGRYETAAAINALFFEADSVYLANGQGFADALAAGPIAARTGSPLYLSLPNCVPSYVLSEVEALGARNVVVVGGTGVLSNRVLNGTPC